MMNCLYSEIMFTLDNFLVMESMYGKFILPRHCTPGPPTPDPASTMLRTGKTHIEDELSNILYLVSKLPENSIIVDGGANMGFFSIPVAQAVKERGSKVIAFEPQKQLFYALGGTIALNELDNVFLHNLGIGDKQTVAQLSEVSYSQVSDYGMVSISEILSINEIPYLRYNTCEVITIDSMNLPRLDFLKLDIEGFECQALRGSLNTITKFKPWIWIEYNMAGEQNIKKELENIKEYRYQIIDWQNMLIGTKEQFSSIGFRHG